jgi:copper homeostasis protein
MPILEVIACSVDDAIAAERGGAGRLELVRSLEAGGLTPPLSLVGEIVAAVSIPVRVMLRENAGYATSGDAETRILCDAARECAALRVDGLVLGFLRGRDLDLPLLERMLGCAVALKATFHRAFEELEDSEAAIASLKTLPQFDHILISEVRVSRLERLVKLAATEIGIIVGGGLSREAIQRLARTTGIREFHVGRAVRRNGKIGEPVDAERVRELAGFLEKTPLASSRPLDLCR